MHILWEKVLIKQREEQQWKELEVMRTFEILPRHAVRKAMHHNLQSRVATTQPDDHVISTAIYLLLLLRRRPGRRSQTGRSSSLGRAAPETNLFDRWHRWSIQLPTIMERATYTCTELA